MHNIKPGHEMGGTLIKKTTMLCASGGCLAHTCPHLVVQGEVLNRAGNSLPALGTQANHFEPGSCNFLGQLVHAHIAGCTHQHLAASSGAQMVDDGGACHSLTSAGRALRQAGRQQAKQPMLRQAIHG
jgi:hypothetical protein